MKTEGHCAVIVSLYDASMTPHSESKACRQTSSLAAGQRKRTYRPRSVSSLLIRLSAMSMCVDVWEEL
jgi:hypothetical protein